MVHEEAELLSEIRFEFAMKVLQSEWFAYPPHHPKDHRLLWTNLIDLKLTNLPAALQPCVSCAIQQIETTLECSRTHGTPSAPIDNGHTKAPHRSAGIAKIIRFLPTLLNQSVALDGGYYAFAGSLTCASRGVGDIVVVKPDRLNVSNATHANGCGESHPLASIHSFVREVRNCDTHIWWLVLKIQILTNASWLACPVQASSWWSEKYLSDVQLQRFCIVNCKKAEIRSAISFCLRRCRAILAPMT